MGALGSALIVVGCATSDVPTIGGRPLIYKQGPGDAAAQSANTASARQAAPPPASPQPAATPQAATPQAAAAPTVTPQAEAAPPAAAPVPVAAPPPALPPSAGTLAPALARYTQATRYGDMLFLSGQIAIDPRTGDFAADAPVEQQTRQVLENVRAILETHGFTMTNIVSVTLYLANMNSLGAVDAVYSSFFKGTLPARSVVEVQKLPRTAQLEIAVVAGK
jgi:2-iminobutanoate/2-iminopropanoate deaminase